MQKANSADTAHNAVWVAVAVGLAHTRGDCVWVPYSTEGYGVCQGLHLAPGLHTTVRWAGPCTLVQLACIQRQCGDGHKPGDERLLAVL
jgi:hypothetical protein